MLKTVWAKVSNGNIKLSEPLELPEGAQVLVTIVSEPDDDHWLEVSASALDEVWGNPEDDVYAQLLKE